MAFSSLRCAMRKTLHIPRLHRFAGSSQHWQTLSTQRKPMTVMERDASLKEQYMELKVSPADDITVSEARIKRLMYRSKQRGRREVDLLLGNWAQEEVPKLDADELVDFEYLLELETTEIHDVILGSVEPPPALKNSKVLRDIIEYGKQTPVVPT